MVREAEAAAANVVRAAATAAAGEEWRQGWTETEEGEEGEAGAGTMTEEAMAMG